MAGPASGFADWIGQELQVSSTSRPTRTLRVIRAPALLSAAATKDLGEPGQARSLTSGDAADSFKAIRAC